MGDFRKLDVWKRAKNVAVKIYKMTESKKFIGDFNLKNQMRRSAVSIASNIAEGDERLTNKESIRFLYIANGSIAELITQLIIAVETRYISETESKKIIEELEEISMMIKSLIKYRIDNDNQKPKTSKTSKTQHPAPKTLNPKPKTSKTSKTQHPVPKTLNPKPKTYF